MIVGEWHKREDGGWELRSAPLRAGHYVKLSDVLDLTETMHKGNVRKTARAVKALPTVWIEENDHGTETDRTESDVRPELQVPPDEEAHAGDDHGDGDEERRRTVHEQLAVDHNQAGQAASGTPGVAEEAGEVQAADDPAPGSGAALGMGMWRIG